MCRPYMEIRIAMLNKDMTQLDLCEKIGKSDSYFSEHINGKKPFDFDTAYKILDVLEIPRQEVYRYFPPRGKA